MTTKAEAVKKIEDHAVDPFLEGANLELRGMSISGADLALVDLRDPFQVDDRFAPLDETGRGHGFLKNAIAEIAGTDPEMQAELRKRGVVDEGQPHKFFLGDGTEATVY